MVEHQQVWYFRVLLHLDKLLCSAVVFHFTRSGRCVLFPSGCVQLQLNSYSDIQPWRTCVRCSLSSLQNASNGSPSQRLHKHLYTIATHTAFDYELVTWVVVVLNPSAYSLSLTSLLFFSRSEMALLRLHPCQPCQNRAAHLFVLYGY